MTSAPAWRLLDERGCRRLAAAVLLKAALDAHAGDKLAASWLVCETARLFADELGLGELWPPAPSQLAGLRDLRARARKLALADGLEIE